jgi:hypothetical protein
MGKTLLDQGKGYHPGSSRAINACRPLEDLKKGNVRCQYGGEVSILTLKDFARWTE